MNPMMPTDSCMMAAATNEQGSYGYEYGYEQAMLQPTNSFNSTMSNNRGYYGYEEHAPTVNMGHGVVEEGGGASVAR